MRNKLTFFLIAAILLCSQVTADVKPNVVVSEFGIKEGSASVGKDFTLSVTFSNTQSSGCAKYITANVEAGFP